ncbi:MAG: HAD hydrolase-like protein [Candidatus Vogelbacteria bacterium]|nr:HAD hydrolase-like protein [Candidatus Vogelbacteria bacterium]
MERLDNEIQSELTEEDRKDREDFLYLLSIMDKQRAVGVTQPLDYQDAITYRDTVESFSEHQEREGSITTLFNDIIFDFDGVLYDSTYSVYRALELTLDKKADKNIPTPTSVEDIANSYQAPFQDYYKRFGISLNTPEELTDFKDTYREVQTQVNNEHHTPAALYPEVKDVLNKLKEAKQNNPNLKIHIISAGSEKYIKEVLAKENIAEDFDEIHADCHDKSGMIQIIADKGETREKTVMIGDLPSDIKDAKRVEGVKTIAVARGDNEYKRLGMYLPDYIVEDLEGVLDLRSYSKELRQEEEHE